MIVKWGQEVHMEALLFSFVIFVLAALGFGIGVIFKGKPLKGHCGGGGGDHDCHCDNGEPEKCCDLERL